MNTFPCIVRPDPATAEAIWHEACYAYLRALFGASGWLQIRAAAEKVHKARALCDEADRRQSAFERAKQASA
jgi:hypothetical protein